jgi:hypothetical protein
MTKKDVKDSLGDAGYVGKACYFAKRTENHQDLPAWSKRGL